MANFNQIPFDDATDPQMRAFATDFLGLDLEGANTPAAVRQRVRTAHAGDHIFVTNVAPISDRTGTPPPMVDGSAALRADAEAHVVHDITGTRTQGGVGRNDPRAVIMIPSVEVDGKTIADDVLVGVNGVSYQIQRDKQVAVPLRVLKALQLTVKTTITHDPGTGDETRRDVPSYQFQIIEQPSRAEQDAWERSLADQFCPA